jgi:peptidoglycan/LPS O-acetylase OafA/YrhL
LANWIFNRPLFLYIGTVSYSLYLVHPYTYYLCRLIFVQVGLFTSNVFLSMTLFFVVVTPITLVATHLVHITLERWPYAWFFRQGIYRERRTLT